MILTPGNVLSRTGKFLLGVLACTLLASLIWLGILVCSSISVRTVDKGNHKGISIGSPKEVAYRQLLTAYPAQRLKYKTFSGAHHQYDHLDIDVPGFVFEDLAKFDTWEISIGSDGRRFILMRFQKDTLASIELSQSRLEGP